MKALDNRGFRTGFIVFIFILVSLLMNGAFFYNTLPLNAQETGVPILAPLNPDFIQHMKDFQSFGVQRQTVDGNWLGCIPPPLDLSHLKGMSVQWFGASNESYPASYDLRTEGKVTPVRDQLDCGSCWAFATYGSLESILLPSETWDFSENHLKNTHGFDWGHCDGGNAGISSAYLARWSGPITETDDPYNINSNISPPGLSERKHIQEVLFIPEPASPLGNGDIKQAMITYGALQVSFYYDDPYYNNTYSAYNYNGLIAYTNHCVTLVGWDDNFNKNLFSHVPPGNGAYIAKNSWGTAWGENGYFYISYYDVHINKFVVAFNGAEPVTNYSRVYEYDPLGWVVSLGYVGSNTAWFANIFTSEANEDLSAVSFYTASPDSTYDIYIFTDVTLNPIGGTLMDTTTGTAPLPGYHTISLSSSIPMASGQKFSVVVRLTTPGYNYPVPLEYPEINYSSQATAIAGQSFISPDGAGWTDITFLYDSTNVCIKAFTTTPISKDNLIVVGDIDCNGLDDLIVDFGATYGIWVRYDDGSWEQLHGMSPEIMIVGDIDCNGLDDLIVDFGATYGIWVRYDDGSWEQLHGLSPDIMVVGDIDGNGCDDLIVDFGATYGIWVRYDDGTWEQLHGLSPDIMVVGDIDGNGCDDLIVDFGATYGIWVRYDDGTWEQLHGLSPDIMVVGDIDGNGLDDLVVDFGATYGIWVRYDDGSWEQLHGMSPEIMIVGDIDCNGLDDLIVDFGATYGIWVRYDDGSWEQLHGLSPDIMVVGDIDGNGCDDLIVDFGATYGIWVRYDDGTWEQLHGLSCSL